MSEEDHLKNDLAVTKVGSRQSQKARIMTNFAGIAKRRVISYIIVIS